jgi:large subunit ribosomal protein L10
VVKNNLAEIASQGTPSEQVLKGLRGMTSMAYTTNDPVALAKALTAYAKANPSFTFKAGVVEGRAIDVKSIGELATMPSKEQIFAKLLYLINAPAQRLAMTINAAGRYFGRGDRSRCEREQVFRRRSQRPRCRFEDF